MPVSEKWFKIFKIMAERLTTKEYEEVTDPYLQVSLN